MKKTKDFYRLTMTLMLLFLLGCIIGWVYEMLFYRIDTGSFIKRGQGFGPWLPIYGAGTMMIIPITSRLKGSKLAVFAVSASGAGVIEWIAGWILFRFANGLRLWNYNEEIWNWGNIGGFVCLRSVLIFGCLGLLINNIIVPLVINKTREMKKWTLTAMTLPLFTLFVLDFIYGYLIKPILKIM